jgi:ribose/xylose/arabinose/galactoside ABC-type transport system permease subunit
MSVTAPRRRILVRPLLPNLVWEGILLLVLLLVIVLARGAQPRLFDTSVVWFQWAFIGLLGSAAALSLRMATPNLAVSAFAAAGSAWFVDRVNDGSSVAVAGIVTVLLCLVLGLLLGAFVGLTGAPAWAASLAAFGLLQALLLSAAGNGTPDPLRGAAALTSGDATAWFLLFVIVSVGGAIVLAVLPGGRLTAGSAPLRPLAAVPGVGGRFALPGAGFTSSRLVSALVGLGGSSALAGLAGVLWARRLTAGQVVVPVDLLLLAFGVALLGGVGVYGLHGGILGVVLASGIVAVIVVWNGLAGRPGWYQWVLGAVTILVGLLVGWLMALLARRWVAV